MGSSRGMRNSRHAGDVWAVWVAECEAGATSAEVAARHGVKERTLRWWRSRLKMGGAPSTPVRPADARLLPVIVDADARGEVQFIVGDCRVTFPMDTPIALVKQLVAVLRAC